MTGLALLLSRFTEWTGIGLPHEGALASAERLVRARARALGLGSIDEYVRTVAHPDHPEVQRLIDGLTVGHTWLYRDGEQLDLAVSLLQKQHPAGGRRNVWVPACSSGEDAYMISLLALEQRQPVAVLGTDINNDALQQARHGRYGAWSMHALPERLRGWFRVASDGSQEVVPPVRSQVRFERHNLRSPPPVAPPPGGWDLILCRNVLIYFTHHHQRQTIARLAAALAPGGWLLLGANEQLMQRGELEPVAFGSRYALRRRARPSAAPARPPSPVATPPPPAAVMAAATRSLLSSALVQGHQRLAAGDTGAALACYARAHEIDPLSAEIHLMSGIAHHAAREDWECVRALRRALFLAPTLWPAAFYLGVTFERLGHRDEAIREYRRVLSAADQAIELAPANPVMGDLEKWRREAIAAATAGLARCETPGARNQGP